MDRAAYEAYPDGLNTIRVEAGEILEQYLTIWKEVMRWSFRPRHLHFECIELDGAPAPVVVCPGFSCPDCGGGDFVDDKCEWCDWKQPPLVSAWDTLLR